MKKLLLSLSFFVVGVVAYGQVICAGVSPASVVGNYEFTWADPAGGDWSCPDFLTPGVFVEDTLMLVEDGTPGLNPQGNPISQEGCNPLINDLTGKIAVIYRNTCEFGTKALNAQNAGAVACIIVNREDGVVSMGGGADGLNVTIPVVFVSNVTGAILVNEMANGPVVMFLGNKFGAFSDDVGANNGEMLIAPFGGSNTALFEGFDPGIQLYNFGTNAQDVTITATIDGPSGNVYTDVVGPITMNSTDTLSIFPGNGGLGGYEFAPFTLASYPTGTYTLTYTMSIPVTDESDFDNVLSSEFRVNNSVISLSRLDASDMPVATTYPSNSTTEYQGCMMFQEANASNVGIRGAYFIPHADTSTVQLEGAEIFLNAYQWDDAWVDLDDPNYAFDPTTNDAFQNLNLLTFTDYFPNSDNEVDQVAYADFNTPFIPQDNVRYLFCLQTFESVNISFGYDQLLNYSGNEGIYRQPVSPVHVDGSWYVGGWSGTSAISMGLRTFDPAELGLESTEMIEGSAYPNPAQDLVTVSVAGEGAAVLSITDVAGKLIATENLTLNNGKADVNIASLQSGMYIFNVKFEDGQASQFNVVKK